MEQEYSERRQFGRLNLLAYGIGKQCDLLMGEMACMAELIDISAGGARLRLHAPLAVEGGRKLVFSVQNVSDKGALQRIASTVRWQSGLEIGLRFDNELRLAVSALQKLIC
jgi:hypothetical protein